jgi:hypothetical protein
MTIYSASFPDVSDQWPMKDDVTREINAIDKALKADLALLPPLMDYEEGGQAVLISQHIYSEQAYRTRPALAAWRARLVPTALAIFVVQIHWKISSPKARRWTRKAVSGLSMLTTPSACAPARGFWRHWWTSTSTTTLKVTG